MHHFFVAVDAQVVAVGFDVRFGDAEALRGAGAGEFGGALTLALSRLRERVQASSAGQDVGQGVFRMLII